MRRGQSPRDPGFSTRARYNNIRYVRDSGQLDGDEWDAGFKNITGENTQQIRTYKLRNIPFLAVGNPEKYRWGGSDPQSPAQRELYWSGGTKYPGVTEGVFNLGTVAGTIVLNLKTPFTWN